MRMSGSRRCLSIIVANVFCDIDGIVTGIVVTIIIESNRRYRRRGCLEHIPVSIGTSREQPSTRIVGVCSDRISSSNFVRYMQAYWILDAGCLGEQKSTKFK